MAEATSAQADVYGAVDDRGADEYDAEVDDHDAAGARDCATSRPAAVFTLSDGGAVPMASSTVCGALAQPGLPAKPSIGASVREAVGQFGSCSRLPSAATRRLQGRWLAARPTRRLEDPQLAGAAARTIRRPIKGDSRKTGAVGGGDARVPQLDEENS